MGFLKARRQDQSIVHQPHRRALVGALAKAETMTDLATDKAVAQPRDARELQTHLYREIGISAVAAALRFINQPDPDEAPATERVTPHCLRDEPKAA